MKSIALKLTTLLTPLALAACASSQLPPPAPMPQPLEAMTPVLASQSAPVAPATQPTEAQKPAQPTLAQILAQRQKPAELPAGHPQLPSNHPQLPAAPATQPAADVSLAQMLARRQGKPSATQPANAAGIIRVRAVQGTANGPKIGVLPVSIDLYQGENIADKIEGKLDAQGTFNVEGVPAELSPVVRISYNGVEYTGAGQVSDGKGEIQPIQVTVYETSEAAPAWQIKMHHVMLEPAAEGVAVMEMMSVENATDRAWIGKAGSDNKRKTVTFPLPAGASDVQFGGAFHDCCTKVVDGKVVSEMPLVPGTTQYTLVYKMPVSGGKANFVVATPAPIGSMMVFAPDDGSTIVAQGIEDGGLATMGGGKTRVFRANNLAAGAKIELAMSNLSAKPQAAMASSSKTAKIVAGAGGLSIFLVGGMFLLRKGPGSAKK
jgi:hypothetical protein